MEERVRVCRACHAIVGWFALFCETCGAKQEHGASDPTPPGGAPAGAPGLPVAGGEQPAAKTLEDGIRTQLMAPAGDARAVARDLFQTQLRLIHKNREGVESLLRDVESIKKALAAAAHAGSRDAVRQAFDAVSEKVYEAEQRWGELQVAYNRESEIIEEESREHMEAADFDAYLSPDENTKVETEFSTLREEFERVDNGLRDVGRDLARGRQESESRYLGGAGRGGSRPWGLLVLTFGLIGLSTYFMLSYTDPNHLGRGAAILGPLVFALGIWVIRAFSGPGR